MEFEQTYLELLPDLRIIGVSADGYERFRPRFGDDLETPLGRAEKVIRDDWSKLVGE